MSLIGKLTFSLLGLKFFGLHGLLWGFLLGHILIDRSNLYKKLFHKTNEIDDNIRLLLPYRYYVLYDKFISHIFGKIWGIILGFVIFGWKGAIIFAIVGHFSFDLSDNPYIKQTKCFIETQINKNLIKIVGFIFGFALQSNILIFTGIIIGFFIDNVRSNKGLFSRTKPFSYFWPRINLLNLALSSKDSRNIAFVQSMTALCAKLAAIDGEINFREARAFDKIFRTSPNFKDLKEIFRKELDDPENVEPFAKQIMMITKGDISSKEDVIDNLFKIINSDGSLSMTELELIKKISKIIHLPDGNFSAIRKRYETQNCCNNSNKDYYQILGVSCNDSNNEIRIAWRNLTAQHHPDKIMANGGNAEEAQKSTIKMAEINEAYQQIMKNRKSSNE